MTQACRSHLRGLAGKYAEIALGDVMTHRREKWRQLAQKAGEAVAGKKEEADANRPAKDLATQTDFWSKEAIVYLGLDRLGLKRPDMALQRQIKKGALKPTKIGGRLVFKKAELDRVLEKGDGVRGRGRPRKDGA